MRLLRAILVGLSGLIAVGCGDGGVQSPDFTPELTKLVIVPSSATVAAGRTFQFTAVGTWTLPPGSGADTEERPVGGVDWGVSNANASIDDDGLATALLEGSAQITARAEGVDAIPANLDIDPAELDSITITPGNTTISLGNSQIFQANGNYSDGTSSPLAVLWESSAPGVATVTNGPATSTSAQSVAQGTTTITATSVDDEDIQGSVVLTVGPFVPTLVSITVTPDDESVGIGQSVQYVADGQCTMPPPSMTTEACTPPNVVWSVGTPAVATIGASSGIANAKTVGTTSVTATSGTVTGSTTLTVVAAVVTNLIVSPETATVGVGGEQVFTATAVFSDSTTGPIEVSWSSSPTTVATVSSTEEEAETTATGVAIGTATITASTTNALGDPIEGTATLEVTDIVLEDLIRVETADGDPQGRTTPGRAVEFVAIGRFSDDSEAQIDDANITWTSSTPGVATIDAEGFATGVAGGQTTITATRKDDTDDSATAILIVTDEVCSTPLLQSDGATVTPFTSDLCVGCSVTNPGNIINADFEDFGLVSTTVGLIGAEAGVDVEAVTNPLYTVPFDGADGNTVGFVIGKPAGTLITAEVLSQVFVETLLNGAVQESTSDGGTPLRLDLLGTQLIGGSEIALVSFKTSQSYDALRLTVNSGTASALSTVQVFQACATVEPPEPVATLVSVSRVEPATATVTAGATTSFTAYGNYGALTEAPLSDADLDWTSSDPSVATVNANGVVTGVSAGTATITATLKEGVSPSVMGVDRSAETVVTVVGNLCATPILASSGATMSEAKTPVLCLLCDFSDTSNVIDSSSTTFGTIHVPLGLLGATASVTASSNSLTPYPGTGSAGFIISRPVGELLLAELLSQIDVTTLLNGVVVQSSAVSIPLRADLLGIPITGGGGGKALVSIPTTLPYNQLRLTFNSGLLTAGILENTLQTVNVYQACSSVTLPPAP